MVLLIAVTTKDGVSEESHRILTNYYYNLGHNFWKMIIHWEEGGGVN